MSGKHKNALSALDAVERWIGASKNAASAEPDELARVLAENCASFNDDALPLKIRARLDKLAASILFTITGVRKTAKKEARAEIVAFVARAFVVALYLLVVGFSLWDVSFVFVTFPVACVEYALLRESYVLKLCAKIAAKAAFWK